RRSRLRAPDSLAPRGSCEAAAGWRARRRRRAPASRMDGCAPSSRCTCRRLARSFDFDGCRGLDREDRAPAVRAVARVNGAAQRFDEAATDGETEAGPDAPAIPAFDAVELLEHRLELAVRNTGAFVRDLEKHGGGGAMRGNRDRRARRRVLRGIVE